MFYDDGVLAVYNGSEDRYAEDSEMYWMTPKQCCGVPPPGHPKLACMFEMESKENEEMFYKIHFGEPFEVKETADSEVVMSWTPITPLEALRRAVDYVCTLDDVRKLINKRMDYMEEHFYVAVSLAKTFIQLNFTGPDLSPEMMQKLELLEVVFNEKFAGQDLYLLQIDGIEIDSSIKHPLLLLLARSFLSSLEFRRETFPYCIIWKFRIFFLHQRMLTKRSGTLSRQLKWFADKYINWLKAPCHAMVGKFSDINGSFLCEIVEMLVYYFDGLLSERVIGKALEAMDMRVEFTGKMGFRTKFQQDAKSQTVVTVAANVDEPECDPPYANAEGRIPKSTALDDDTRLERLRLADGDEPHVYRDVHQVALVSMLMQKRGFKEETELKRQEVEALINAILDRPVSWAARVSALVTRCHLEKQDRRAVGRAMRQIEDISKFVARKLLDANDEIFRQYMFFGCGHPLKIEVKMLLGEVLMSLDHWKEALTIYSELGAFEQVVKCYQMMDLRHKAEEIIREKIAQHGKTPRLLVLLGDATSDASFYEEAWTLSKGKSCESQVRLGYMYFSRKEYGVAKTHLKNAVELAPLDYPTWLKLAWACYQTDDYENGFQAYLRSANLEYDNFQVWNNLANCALKLNKKDYALRAYKQAIKCNYDEWKVWSNVLLCAVDLNALNDAIQAYHRLLDLKKDFLDETALEKMGIYATDHIIPPNTTIVGALARLVARVTTTSSRSGIVWAVYGRVTCLYVECDDCDDEEKWKAFVRAMQYYDKSLTIMRQKPDWKTNLKYLENVITVIIEYRIHREHGTRKLGAFINVRMKELDRVLMETAKSVHVEIQRIISENPIPNQWATRLRQQIGEEVLLPFYQREPGSMEPMEDDSPSE